MGSAYFAEWSMVYRELIVGFLIAGAVAALVPASFFEAIFPEGGSDWYLVPPQALLAPLLAFVTVIGSMGNGPLHLGVLATFAIDYTFWLNVLALTVAAVMFVLPRKSRADRASSEHQSEMAGR